MINLFRHTPLARAHKAILTNDKDKLIKQLRKITPTEIDQASSVTTPGLVETCIIQQRPKLLQQILEHGASASGNGTNDLPFGILSLQQAQSLPLLTALLAAGNDEDRNQLAQACFKHCPPAQLMLHIGLLLQYGAEINDPLYVRALTLGERPLIHFLINSGATLPESTNTEGVSEDILTYAKRCEEDLRIRQMLL